MHTWRLGPQESRKFQLQFNFLCHLLGDDQGAMGTRATVCAYSFYGCKIQIRQVYISVYVNLRAEAVYLHLFYNLYALISSICNLIVIISPSAQEQLVLYKYRCYLIQLQFSFMNITC